MDVGDCSLWHHLIFCEGLESDRNNQVVCWLCKIEILGRPAYKCLECNFFLHKSCTKPTNATEMKVEHHYLRGRHHLIFVEEPNKLNNGDKQKVVCMGCKEPAFGPTYKCSIPRCTFYLHKSCSELSHVIQNPMHPKHTLFLRVSRKNVFFRFIRERCYVCHKPFKEYCFVYNCSLCHFVLEVKCASRWRLSDEECNQHALFPMRKQMQLTCEACGEEIKDIAYLCSICRVLIHGKCDQFPHTIKITIHDHSLIRTYFLGQVKKQGNVFCKLCYRKVNTEYGAYYCKRCDYIAHLSCGLDQHTESFVGNSIGYESHLVHLVEGISRVEDQIAGPKEIKHFSHPQHNLIQSNEEFIDDKRCEACMQFIIPGAPFYGCTQCKFFIHNRCTKVPTTIKRGLLHQHPLTLFSQAPSMGGLFWCDACRRYRNGFTYSCDKCSRLYEFDVQCCLIPDTLKHEGHQHSLFLVKGSLARTCNACGTKEGVNSFACTDCDEFTLCIRCATLPLVTRYAYDIHLLKLSYTREDNFGDYYCLICEEKREHPDYWFYYCVKCDFSSHVQCILGENPCINYGRTFTNEDHKHPLTVVQKSEHSPPCDVCGEHFYDGMALECTQCKCNIHHSHDLSRISKRE